MSDEQQDGPNLVDSLKASIAKLKDQNKILLDKELPPDVKHQQVIDSLTQQIEDQGDDLFRYEDQVRTLQQQMDDLAMGQGPPPGSMGPPLIPPIADIVDWVDVVLCRYLEQTPGTMVRWCRRWYLHPEGAFIVALLHADFNRAMMDESLGWQAWIKQSLFYYWPYLSSPTGPFAGCNSERHEEPVHLPTTDRHSLPPNYPGPHMQ